MSITGHTIGTPMDAETLEALRGSIAKWEGIVAGTVVNNGTLNCPLCKMFRWPRNCRGCPVNALTGKTGCIDTPYHNYADIQNSDDFSDDEKRERAQAELDFLKSLLPHVSDEQNLSGENRG